MLMVYTYDVHCMYKYMYINDMYIRYSYTYVHCTYMYIHPIFDVCSCWWLLLISGSLFCVDGLEKSSKRLLLCCKTQNLILTFSKDIDPDLHQRMDQAVRDGRIKYFNMRERVMLMGTRISTCGYVSWKMFVGRLWKIHCSRATRTLNSKWI